MSKELDIRNIEDLRMHAISTITQLKKGTMEVQEAGVMGKLYETVISSLKTELQYASMTDTIPEIRFLEGGGTTVTVKKQKAIGNRK